MPSRPQGKLNMEATQQHPKVALRTVSILSLLLTISILSMLLTFCYYGSLESLVSWAHHFLTSKLMFFFFNVILLFVVWGSGLLSSSPASMDGLYNDCINKRRSLVEADGVEFKTTHIVLTERKDREDMELLVFEEAKALASKYKKAMDLAVFEKAEALARKDREALELVVFEAAKALASKSREAMELVAFEKAKALARKDREEMELVVFEKAEALALCAELNMKCEEFIEKVKTAQGLEDLLLVTVSL